MRDREIYAYAIFWWLCIVVFVLLGPMHLHGTALLIGALAAIPVSFAAVVLSKRSDAKQALRRERLRAENRFSEAAEHQADSFYVAGLVWGGSYLAVAFFLLIGSFVLGNPAALAGALWLGGIGAWRVFNYRSWWREEREHRRTSAERIASAAEGLTRGNWERQQPPSE